MLIKAGSSLLVPRGAHTEGDVSERVADNAQLSFAPEQTQKRTQIKVGKKDSLASIAKRYGQSPANIVQWNHLSASAALKPGQTLVLYLPATTRTASRNAAPTRGKTQAVAKARAPSAKGAQTAQAKPRVAATKTVKTAKASTAGKARKTTPNTKNVRVAQR